MMARGSIYTTIMALGPQSHNQAGLLGSTSIMPVHSIHGPSAKGGKFRSP